jgi:hypothetical protein
MQVKRCLASLCSIVFALWLGATWSCFAVTSGPGNFSEARLRSRIALVRSHFAKGDFEAYIAIWSARKRPGFRESDEDWQKNVRIWKSFLREKPKFELIDLEISGQRARAKMRVSVSEPGGSRSYDVLYDYWVFEDGDWFLEDADRTK